MKAIADAVLVSFCFFAAFHIRFDGNIPASHLANAVCLFPLLIGIRVGSTWFVARYRLRWRYTSVSDVRYILQGQVFGTLAFWFALSLLDGLSVPRGVLAAEAVLSITGMLALRLGIRLIWSRLSLAGHPRAARRVLVIGAGYAGSRIVRDMREDPGISLVPVGFADDDPAKRDSLINGVRVLGATEDVPDLVRRHGVDQVLIAIPSLSGAGLSGLLKRCAGSGADLTILPGLPQILTSQGATRSIRKVRVEDLLERQPVRVDVEAFAGYISGQRVLITGAGGSIGAELCRQVAGLNPEALILLGQGENSVFWIERELREEFGLNAVAVIADIKDRPRLNAVLREHRPSVVFHAAAHKHVPLMEANPCEAAKNNVIGTRNLVELSIRHRVSRFVMVSTDKAVNPTSVMGASKRVAEMVVQSFAQRMRAHREGNGDACPHVNHISLDGAITRFAAVRFGNVLGSRGSVIPTMQKQIERGGPVTVTHPDMVRYFMTIPEAVQLVIQAGAMARDGEVFVLDMGQPVHILDLARNLIRLSGYIPDDQIRIEFTGIRPGEKLFEEVLTAEEGTTATAHKRIFMARPALIRHEFLSRSLDDLEQAAHRDDGKAVRALLRALVPSFRDASNGAGARLPIPEAHDTRTDEEMAQGQTESAPLRS